MHKKMMIIALITVSLCGFFGVRVDATYDTVKIYFDCNRNNISNCRSQQLSDIANPMYNNCSKYQYNTPAADSKAVYGSRTIFSYQDQKVVIEKCLSYHTSAKTVNMYDQSCKLGSLESIVYSFFNQEANKIKECQQTFQPLKPLKVKINVCENIFLTKDKKPIRAREFDELTFDDCDPIDSIQVDYLKLSVAKPTKSPEVAFSSNVSGKPNAKITTKKVKSTGISATLVKVKLSSGNYSNNCYQRLNSTIIGNKKYWVVRDRGDLSVTGGRKTVPSNSDLIYVLWVDIKQVGPSDCKAEIIYRK